MPSAQGHGYAVEAASLLLDFCFDQLDLHRVYAELDPRNTASFAKCNSTPFLKYSVALS